MEQRVGQEVEPSVEHRLLERKAMVASLSCDWSVRDQGPWVAASMLVDVSLKRRKSREAKKGRDLSLGLGAWGLGRNEAKRSWKRLDQLQ